MNKSMQNNFQMKTSQNTSETFKKNPIKIAYIYIYTYKCNIYTYI